MRDMMKGESKRSPSPLDDGVSKPLGLLKDCSDVAHYLPLDDGVSISLSLLTDCSDVAQYSPLDDAVSKPLCV